MGRMGLWVGVVVSVGVGLVVSVGGCDVPLQTTIVACIRDGFKFPLVLFKDTKKRKERKSMQPRNSSIMTVSGVC